LLAQVMLAKVMLAQVMMAQVMLPQVIRGLAVLSTTVHTPFAVVRICDHEIPGYVSYCNCNIGSETHNIVRSNVPNDVIIHDLEFMNNLSQSHQSLFMKKLHEKQTEYPQLHWYNLGKILYETYKNSKDLTMQQRAYIVKQDIEDLEDKIGKCKYWIYCYENDKQLHSNNGAYKDKYSDHEIFLTNIMNGGFRFSENVKLGIIMDTCRAIFYAHDHPSRILFIDHYREWYQASSDKRKQIDPHSLLSYMNGHNEFNRSFDLIVRKGKNMTYDEVMQFYDDKIATQQQMLNEYIEQLKVLKTTYLA